VSTAFCQCELNEYVTLCCYVASGSTKTGRASRSASFHWGIWAFVKCISFRGPAHVESASRSAQKDSRCVVSTSSLLSTITACPRVQYERPLGPYKCLQSRYMMTTGLQRCLRIAVSFFVSVLRTQHHSPFHIRGQALQDCPLIRVRGMQRVFIDLRYVLLLG